MESESVFNPSYDLGVHQIPAAQIAAAVRTHFGSPLLGCTASLRPSKAYPAASSFVTLVVERIRATAAQLKHRHGLVRDAELTAPLWKEVFDTEFEREPLVVLLTQTVVLSPSYLR